jgi:hypothetical protein
MEGQEFRSRLGRVVIDDAGVTVMEFGTTPLFVPWYAVGRMQNVELGRGVARVRLVRIHLTDGRTVPLPAPSARRGRAEAFDLAAAEIFRVWRNSSRARIREPQDEIPPEYRAEAARKLDPFHDAVPPAGDSILRRWIRRRIDR